MRLSMCSGLVCFVCLHVIEARQFRSLREKDRTGQQVLDMMLVQAPRDHEFPEECYETFKQSKTKEVPRDASCNEYPALQKGCSICLDPNNSNQCKYFCIDREGPVSERSTIVRSAHVMVARCSYSLTPMPV